MAGSAAVYTKKVLFLSFSKTRLDYIEETQAPHASQSLLRAFSYGPTMAQMTSPTCPQHSCFMQHAQEDTFDNQEFKTAVAKSSISRQDQQKTSM